MAHRRLRLYAAIAAVLAILQPVLAIVILTLHSELVSRVHEGLGFLYVVAAALASFPAKIWGDQSHNKELFPHAAGMAVLGVVQVVLGITGAPEDDQPMGPAIYAHMALGVAILVGAVALYLIARRMPYIVTGTGGRSGKA